MKLQKQLSRKMRDKEYSKWVITIPPKRIEDLGWTEGEELDLTVRGEKLILAKRKVKP
jgi:antitoxin component of MazEF toxin-antitoxin module